MLFEILLGEEDYTKEFKEGVPFKELIWGYADLVSQLDPSDTYNLLRRFGDTIGAVGGRSKPTEHGVWRIAPNRCAKALFKHQGNRMDDGRRRRQG